MKYKIEGQRKNGNVIKRYTNDKKVAYFEFECAEMIADYVALYEYVDGLFEQVKLYINK